MRWKVVSSSSIFSFPFPHFLSVQSNPFFFFLFHYTKYYKMIFNEERKIERKKEREKPLGSVRLVYSRTSLPAIFLFSIPFALQLLSVIPFRMWISQLYKKKKQISLKIRIVFSLVSQFYEFVSVFEDSSTNQNLGIFFSQLLRYPSSLLFYPNFILCFLYLYQFGWHVQRSCGPPSKKFNIELLFKKL